MLIKYSCAFDEKDNLVRIDDVNRDYRNFHSYKCISCGKPLIAKMGDIKVHHFAHKYDAVCDKDRYLHKLGEMMLKKRWDESPSFMISFSKHHEKWCNKAKECIFKSEFCYQLIEEETVDLKKYYQVCTIEKSYKEFVADLLIEDRKGEMPPIMLEVAVTHPCSEEKKKSGIHIIEFDVQSESQAISLGNREISCKSSDKFYGFKYKNIVDYSLDNISYEDGYGEKIVKATLLDTGFIDISYVNCKDIENSQIGNAIAIGFFNPSGGWHPIEYADIPYDAKWYKIRRSYHLKQARLFFAQRGFNIKSCDFCTNQKESNYGEKYCWCYKRHRTPKNPNPSHAYFCRFYRTNYEQIQGVLMECTSIIERKTARHFYPKSPKEDPDKNNLWEPDNNITGNDQNSINNALNNSNSKENYVQIGDEIFNQLFAKKPIGHWKVEEYRSGIKNDHTSIYMYSNLGWINGILIMKTTDNLYAIYIYINSEENICLSPSCDASHVYSLIDDYIKKGNPNSNQTIDKEK